MRSVKMGKGVRQECCLSPILFKLNSKYFTKKALEGFGDFKIGGQVICTVKYADALVLLAKEEMVLQGMFDRLTEIVRCCGMEMNVEETKVMRISRQPFPVQIMIDHKQLKNVEYFNCLGCMITNDATCAHEIKFRIAMAKAVFKTKTFFTSQLD
jgi:hypothetical protein